MRPLPELGGRYALFLFKEGGELACVFELQVVSDLGDIEVASCKKFFGSQ